MSGELKKTGEDAAVIPALDFGRAWEYAPSPEATDHVHIAPRQELFIGGRWVAPRSGKYFDTASPSTEEKLAEVADADERDVDDAVQAARRAYDRYWSKMRGSERAKYLFRIARAIQEKSRELAIVESMDGGKP
ncbi:MAG TPA: aldehyde dehydrogenase family protein, partial [Polyangiaceae bacterium]